MDKIRRISGLLGMLLFACNGVPEYRVEVQSIPTSTRQLEVAAYAQGQMISYPSLFDITDGRDTYSFGVKLRQALGEDAALSVAARDSNGCILAVGTSDQAAGSPFVTSVMVPLMEPNPALVDPLCKIGQPVILAALRTAQGPLSKLQTKIALQGWGFQPNAAVEIRSSSSLLCAPTAACAAKCTGTCTNGTVMGGGMSGNTSTCVSKCPVIPTLIPHGPALLDMNLEDSNNSIQNTASSDSRLPPIDLLTLISQPLTFTLTNPNADGTATFTEIASEFSTGISPR